MTETGGIQRVRCSWCGNDPLYMAYHDEEWGVPCRDDAKLFEFLILEGAQAGLSWQTVLNKREGYRNAFAGFDAEKMVSFGQADLDRLIQDKGIIRNRLKIASAVNNAGRFLEVRDEFGTFSRYIWSFVEDRTIVNFLEEGCTPPAESAQSQAMSRDLKRRGFSFVGSTICYAYMQAMGLVDDHYITCWKRTGDPLQG